MRSSESADAAPAKPASGPAEAFGQGRYRVIRFLGEGARKRVYLAHDERLQREVAVSAFKSEGLDQTAIERSHREAESMGALGDHPNIVTVHDIGEEDGELYLVSQHMSGGDLTGLLAQAEDGRLTVDEVVRLGIDVAAGLAHAHAHGVVHRDVKPHNVWLTPDGTAKLGDFGLAIAGDRSRLTAEGAMVGTVAYMSPEQGLGEVADARSDLYSLGALMYELLCGIPPFTGDGAAAVISQHVSTVPVGPTWHRPDVPKALEQLVLNLLAKNPSERYQSAEEVRAALVAISSLASAPAGPDQETERALDRLSEGAFIGREAETKELRAAVDGAVAGRGRVVMLGGEAGIGKTRLAAEVDAYASLRGAQVLWGRCYEGEGAPAFWPWVQAIRGYVHTRDAEGLRAELGSGASDIAQLVSEVRSRLPDLPEPSAHDGEHSRFRLFDSIASFLVNASRTRPLAIFIEDVHLADSASLELLQFVVREIGAARVFLLCTFRDDDVDESHPLHALQAALARERTYTQMLLGKLSEREVRALLEEVSQQTLTATDELALLAAVWEESGGNPYFIEEIVRHLVESGAVYERDGKWVSDAEHIRDLGIPQGIRDVVGARLARLSRDCRDLLSIAAVIGPEFRLETLESVCGIPAASVLEGLEEAAAAAIVEVKATEINVYRFSHVATRDALYEDVPQNRRVELHGRIGEALEELHGDRIEAHLGELAHHFAAAGPAEKAADYSWWAGEHATGMFAYDEAVTHYERALSLFDTLPDEPVRRCELLLALGDVRWRAGDREGAGRTFIKAAELAERLSLWDQYARAALGYAGGSGGFSVSDNANEKLLELLRNALQTLPERDSLLRVRVTARLAVELSYTSDRAATEELSRAAVEMAERIGDARIVLLAMYSRQWSTMGPDGAAEDLEAGAEIVRLARVVGDREMEFNGHHLRLHRQLQLGDLRGVDREIRSCEKLATELRQPAFEWQTAAFRAMRALLQGRFKEGERLAQTALAMGQRVEPEMAVVVLGAQTFLTSWATGKLREIEPGGAAFAAQYPKSAWPAAYALLVSELDEHAKTRAQFDAIARAGFGTIRRDANWLTAMACLAMACNYLGDAESGRQLYELYAPYADQLTPVLTGSVCFGSNHFFVGGCAEAAGLLDAAAEHYERCLAINESLGALFLHARIYHRFACTLLQRGAPGDLDRAAELVERGLDHARSLGLPRETERLMAIKLDRAGLAGVDVQTSIEAVALSVEQERPDIRPAAAPDGTVTIMFSDIEDSTLLTVKLGDRRWLELLGRHNEIFRRHLAEHGGYEVKSQGDGFMLAFASARRAIKCAIEVQRTLATHRAAHPEDPLKVRIGLHTGETLRAEEDFFGKNVILAARIAAQARGNEILISSLLRELVSSTDDYVFGEERELELKGLSGRYRVSPVSWSDEVRAPRADRPSASEAGSEVVRGAPSFPTSLEQALVPDAVGRDSERELLRTLAHRAREGGLRLAIIGGEPGIGKTELAAHVAHAAHADGAIVLTGRCQEGAEVAYGPWAEALGQYVEHAPEKILEQHAARHAGELGRIVPQLRARLPELPPPVRTADPESERYLVFSAATDLLVQAAAETPVVLVLEDLQWAEPSTAALLERVVRDLEGSPMLLVMSYRPAELGDDQPVAKLLGEPGEDVVRLRLAPLSDAEVGRLLSGAELEPGSPAHELAVEVCREAGGNPSFARELLHHLVETAAVTRDEAGRWVMAEDTEALTLPASLGDLVAKRVDAIGPAAPDVFAAAAVLGREFDQETISSMTGQGTADVAAALRGGVERSLVAESPGGPGAFAFLHGLVERALYQALGADRRRDLHRRAAESLELGRGAPGEAAAIARHWLAAASPETAIRAVTAGLAAGRRALTELAPQEAIRWFDRALALADRHSVSDAGLRCDLLIGLGDAQRQSGDRRYRETLIEACGIARELADGGRLARAALANNRGWANSGRVDHDRVAGLEDALALAADARPATRARLLAQLGAELVYAGDLDRRRGYSDEAVAIARELDDPRTLAYVLGRRCLTIWAPEALDERLESVGDLERAAARLDDPITLLGAASWRVVTSLEAADVAAAEAALERKAELAERIGRPVMRWEVLFARSALAYLHGRLEEAEELAGEAAQVGRDQPDAMAIYGAQIVAIRHDQGRLAEIAEMFLAVAAENPGLSTMRAAVAQVNAEIGRADEARAAMTEDATTGFAKVPKDNLWLTTLAAYADACVELSEEPPMSALYERLEPFADRIATNGVNANGAVALRLGALARSLGRLDDAIAHLDMAEEIHRRVDAPVFLLRTHLEQARTLLARDRDGDRGRGTELLAVASEAAKAHGCRALGDQIAALR